MAAKSYRLVATCRRHRWLLILLACLVPAYLFWTLHDALGAVADDGPAYLMMARHFSPLRSESHVNAAWAATSRFPPFYPLLLGLGGAAGSVLQAHLLTTICLFAGLLFHYCWLRGKEIPHAGAVLLVLAVALMPGTWLASLLVQSEFLYLALSLLALWLLDQHRREARNDLLYAAALVIGLATLTRTIGAALYLPLLLAIARAPRSTAATAIGLAVLPALLWHLLHRSTQSYVGDLYGLYGHQPLAALALQAHRELPALQSGLNDILQPLPLLPRSLMDGLGLLCLVAAGLRALRREYDALYTVLYLAVVSVWPYPEEASRFLWAVAPVAMVQLPLLLSGASTPRWNRRQPLAVVALAALLLAMALPAISFASVRYRQAATSAIPQARWFRAWYEPDPAAAMHAVHSQLIIMQALQRIGDEVPQGQCVIAARPDLVYYFADRAGTWPPLNSVPDPVFQARLRASGCRYVFMSSMIDSIYPVPLHPLQRVRGMIRVIDTVDVADPPPGKANAVSVLAELQ